ncbi:MAG TPA: hypothetical protein PLW65_31225 [Pseudomonadota bacterium]|nr:hypothetical protein [Pseudomonadota bacterium]
MQSPTLLQLAIGTLFLGLLPSCGSSESSVLLTLTSVPARAKLLAVSATLDGRPLTGSATPGLPLSLPLAQNQLGITVPAAGHLALELQALDSDQCLQGRASPELDVQRGLTSLDAALPGQSPRKCGSLAPCALGAACTPPSGVTNSTIRSIWPISPTDIWAVGASATILHYDGQSWTATPPASVPLASTIQLNSVWASASNDVWAVGSAGKIIHYDGTKWALSSSGATRDLQSVSGASGQSVWAVGLAASATTPGEFWRWDGNTWSSITPPGNGSLYTVYALSPSFIIGGGGSNAGGLLWTYDGVSKFTDYTSSAVVEVYALWAADPSRIIAVGAVGEILRFDGTTWRLNSNNITADLRGITNDGTTTYIVGEGGFAVRSTDPTLSNLTSITNVPPSNLWSIQLAKNGLSWFGGDNGYLGYLDTRP